MHVSFPYKKVIINYKQNKFFFFRYLAVGAKGDKPAIFIFDTMTQKKKRNLNFPEGNIKEWV